MTTTMRAMATMETSPTMPSRNRWPQSYIDPAELRREQVVAAFQVGALVIYQTAHRLFVTHVHELGAFATSEDVHQTKRDLWLSDTRTPRREPVAGFVIALG
jgi:hypothetical protein